MLCRIFGKSGSGKTEYVFKKLAECIANKQKAFLIVPEQSAVKTEKEVVEKLGNKSNEFVEVINFKRLCNRVFRQTGGLAFKHPDAGAKKIIMYYALEGVADSLSEYKNSASNPDFVKKAVESVDELNTCAVDVKDLVTAAESLSLNPEYARTAAKLKDISLIASAYSAMNAQMTGESMDIYDRLCEKLSDSAFFSDIAVFIDSFYGFTAKELKIISYIIEDASDLYVTLCCDGKTKDDIFTRAQNTADSLKKIADRADIEIKDVFLSDDLRHEKNSALYVYQNGFCTASLAGEDKASCQRDGITLYRCRDIYAEAKAACALTASLVRRGASYSDVCICAKNISDYDGILDAVFKKSGMPLGTDKPEKLSDSPLAFLISSAFEAAATGSQSAVLGYVKSGLSGLDDDEADSFEIYVRTWNIGPSLMLSDEDWTMNPDGYSENPPNMELLCTVNRARQKIFDCLDGLRAAQKSAKTIRDYAFAVWELLCSIAREGGREEFDDGNGGIYLDLLCRCLDSMTDCAGDKPSTAAGFIRLFRLCCEDYDTGRIPESIDGVMFSPVDLMRASNVRYIILLGVNDGIFPSGSVPSGLLNDSERRVLSQNGIRLYDDADSAAYDELFLAYSAICSAREHAYILYSDETAAGARLYPSVIAESAAKLSGAAREVYDGADIARFYAGDELLLEEYITLEDCEKRAAVKKYLSEKPEFARRIAVLSESFSDSGYLKPETSKMLYGDSITTSYSRLERFNECPFSHFCTYTLKLRPEPVARLGAPEAGSVMHRILEEFVPLLSKSKNDGALMSKEQARNCIGKLLERHFSRIAAGSENASSKRFKHLYNRLSRLLFAMSDSMVEELEQSKFEMCAFELNISQSSDIKPIPISLGDGAVLYISGQIDRVDKYEKDGATYIRIVDYKTGAKSFKKDDILSGFNLQMLLYLYSLCGAASKPFGENTVPAGVMYTNVSAPDAKANLGYDDAELKNSLEPKAVTSGMLIDDKEILLAMDPSGKAKFIPVKLNKDGEITAGQPVIPLEKMGRLLNFAAETAALLAEEIYSGSKEIRPFVNKNINACAYCEMLPVCQGYAEARTQREDINKLGEGIFEEK